MAEPVQAPAPPERQLLKAALYAVAAGVAVAMAEQWLRDGGRWFMRSLELGGVVVVATAEPGLETPVVERADDNGTVAEPPPAEGTA